MIKNEVENKFLEDFKNVFDNSNLKEKIEFQKITKEYNQLSLDAVPFIYFNSFDATNLPINVIDSNWINILSIKDIFKDTYISKLSIQHNLQDITAGSTPFVNLILMIYINGNPINTGFEVYFKSNLNKQPNFDNYQPSIVINHLQNNVIELFKPNLLKIKQGDILEIRGAVINPINDTDTIKGQIQIDISGYKN